MTEEFHVVDEIRLADYMKISWPEPEAWQGIIEAFENVTNSLNLIVLPAWTSESSSSEPDLKASLLRIRDHIAASKDCKHASNHVLAAPD